MAAETKTRLTEYTSCGGCAAKVPPAGVSKLLQSVPRPPDPDLLVGTETHDDAGVYRLAPDLALVQTIDFFPPVLDDPYHYGQVAAANALSDVYAMGGTPRTALNMVCYPDDVLGPDWLARILEGGAERCRAAGCTIVGGHTVRDAEIKFGLAVTGTIHPDRVVTNAGAKPDDVLVLTKPLGTGFVTTAAKRQNCPPELLAAAVASMTTLNAGAAVAMLAVGATAATDVTGFGLCGHAFEMAEGADVTLELYADAFPLLVPPGALDVTQFRTRAVKTNREYVQAETTIADGVDPYRLEFLYDPQTSGGLLIAVPPARADRLLDELRKAGTPAAVVIGEVRPRRPGVRLDVRARGRA